MSLLFLPGFACPTGAYGAFLAALRDAGIDAHARDLSSGLVAQVTGRSTPDDEAQRVGAAAESLRVDGAPFVLGGHSRGGLVSYLAATAVRPDALVLVDPVGGGGPPWAKAEALPTIDFAGPALVVGCGKGGHCAPDGRNHEVFAAALAGCRHPVVADCGHADVLDGHFRTMGRLVCSRGSDPDRARAEIVREVLSFLRDHGLADDRMQA